MEQDNYKGFYKVHEIGGTYVVAYFYNPSTNETFDECVRDYDYDDCSRDNDILYDIKINKEVSKDYWHHRGTIYEGDEIVIAKGRKMVGETKVVKSIKTLTFHGYHQVDYAYFTDGTSCGLHNCRLKVNYEKPISISYSDVKGDE